MKISIIGAGAGGQTAAGHLSLQGHKVTIFNRPHPVEDVQLLAPLKKKGAIDLEGSVTGTGSVDLVTNDMGKAVEGQDLLLVTLPAVGHTSIIEAMKPYLKSGQTVLIHPGQIGTCWATSKILQPEKTGVNLCITHSLIYATRMQEPGKVRVHGVKKRVLCSAFPKTATPKALPILRQAYAQLDPAANALETEISNCNTVLHPTITLSNMRAIESGPKFLFYENGASDSTGKLMDALDKERLAVSSSLGLKALSVQEFLNQGYGVPVGPLGQMLRTNPGYIGVPAPATLNHRYVWEDITCGLIPMAALADVMKIDVPLTKSMIQIFGAVTDWEQATARTAAWLGIKGMSPADLTKLAQQ